MYRALAFKELREAALIGGLVCGAMLLAALDHMGVSLDVGRLTVHNLHRHAPFQAHKVPFVNPELQDMLAIIAVCGAVALGFRQVWWESFRGTWLYLLHRPAPWSALMLTKLAAGGGLLLAATAVPVLLLAAWAATPGTHASPFEWAMAAQPLRLCFGATVLYLAAFLCALREARWYATRFLPLIPAALVMTWVYVTVWWPVTGWVVVLVADGLYLAAILHAARAREYP